MFNVKFTAVVGDTKLISVNEHHERVTWAKTRFTCPLSDDIAGPLGEWAKRAKAALLTGEASKADIEIKAVLCDLSISSTMGGMQIADARGVKAQARIDEKKREAGALPELQFDFQYTWDDETLLRLAHLHEETVDLHVIRKALCSDTARDTMPPAQPKKRGRKPKATEDDADQQELMA